MKKSVLLAILLPVISIGCAAMNTTKLTLTSPDGGVMTFEGVRYTFSPDSAKAGVAVLEQFANPSFSVEDAKPVQFAFPDPAKPGATIAAKGYIYVYAVERTDVGATAVNKLVVDDERLSQLRDGHAITLTGRDPGNQLLYKIVIGLDL